MHTIIAIPATQQDAANDAAESMQHAIDGTGNGIKTFTIPLFSKDAPDDSTPLFYWCAVTLSVANRQAVTDLAPQFLGMLVADYDLRTQPGFPQQFIATNNLRTALLKTKE